MDSPQKAPPLGKKYILLSSCLERYISPIIEVWDERKRKEVSSTVNVFLCDLILRSILLFFSDNHSARDSRGAEICADFRNGCLQQFGSSSDCWSVLSGRDWAHLGACITEQPPQISYLLLLQSRAATRVVFDSEVMEILQNGTQGRSSQLLKATLLRNSATRPHHCNGKTTEAREPSETQESESPAAFMVLPCSWILANQ